MKRLFVRVLSGWLLVLAVCLPAGAAQRPLVLVSYDYPPYMEVQQGRPATGIAVDLVRAVFARMKQPVALQFYPLARSLSLIDTPSADGFFTIKKTAQRERQYLYPREPLLTQDVVVFVRDDARLTFHGNVSELADVRLGVVNNISYGAIVDTAVARGVFTRLEVAQNHEANFRKLLAGRMDALVSSRAVGMAVLQRLGMQDKVKVIGPPIERTQAYLIFNRRTVAPQVVAAFDRALAAMRKDGTLQKLQKLPGPTDAGTRTGLR
ncbi:hypothetical protein ASF61_08715 [Duganella sp. Leaf126]|uniref:substrate-binding periplasmic protein n=1 Tax=Duganella sp. Leaf126 TaxID=1736266 RepID=UPI0006F7BCFB|nr:transporter substrate-binding domain-containing protein [Duganella sp. Leaf126]KQQ36250.1 hypothetical protein ASF61_08715 [Duganella sp. Leaf126]